MLFGPGTVFCNRTAPEQHAWPRLRGNTIAEKTATGASTAEQPPPIAPTEPPIPVPIGDPKPDPITDEINLCGKRRSDYNGAFR